MVMIKYLFSFAASGREFNPNTEALRVRDQFGLIPVYATETVYCINEEKRYILLFFTGLTQSKYLIFCSTYANA